MKRNYTIFISSNDKNGAFREFQLSWKYIRTGLVCVSLIGVFLIAFFVDYMFAFSSHSELKKYKLENQNLRAQLTNIKNKTKKITARLQQIEDFSQKIKFLAGLSDKDSFHPSLLAIGPLTNRETTHMNYPLPTASAPTAHLSAGKVSLETANPDAFSVYLDQWDKKSQIKHQNIGLLLGQLYEKKDILQSTPNRKPVRGWISSTFGYRQYPFNGNIAMHEGIDIATMPGMPVYAPADGTIIFAGYKTGYGKLIIIDHGYQLSTLYGHLSDIMVSKWQKIKRGEVIAATGNTGYSTGPHLHYEVRIDNVPVDPANYMLDDF